MICYMTGVGQAGLSCMLCLHTVELLCRGCQHIYISPCNAVHDQFRMISGQLKLWNFQAWAYADL